MSPSLVTLPLIILAYLFPMPSAFTPHSLPSQPRHRPAQSLRSASLTLLSSSSKTTSDPDPEGPPHYVIIGAGWGGFGAAERLTSSVPNAKVTMLDALPSPGGELPYLSATGRTVEAGTRGFWKDYPNINYLVSRTLGLDEDEVWTDFETSSFYSPDGLEATAPVFGSVPLQLPSPIGQVLATFPLFERLPLPDRASMAGLLVATADCVGSDDEEVKVRERMAFSMSVLC